MDHHRQSSRAAITRLAVARAISITGGAAAFTALMFAVYERTGKSTLWLSAALLVTFGVHGVLGWFAGALGDRFDRKKVLIVSDLAGAAVYVVVAGVARSRLAPAVRVPRGGGRGAVHLRLERRGAGPGGRPRRRRSREQLDLGRHERRDLPRSRAGRVPARRRRRRNRLHGERRHVRDLRGARLVDQASVLPAIGRRARGPSRRPGRLAVHPARAGALEDHGRVLDHGGVHRARDGGRPAARGALRARRGRDRPLLRVPDRRVGPRLDDRCPGGTRDHRAHRAPMARGDEPRVRRDDGSRRPVAVVLACAGAPVPERRLRRDVDRRDPRDPATTRAGCGPEPGDGEHRRAVEPGRRVRVRRRRPARRVARTADALRGGGSRRVDRHLAPGALVAAPTRRGRRDGRRRGGAGAHLHVGRRARGRARRRRGHARACCGRPRPSRQHGREVGGPSRSPDRVEPPSRTGGLRADPSSRSDRGAKLQR